MRLPAWPLGDQPSMTMLMLSSEEPRKSSWHRLKSTLKRAAPAEQVRAALAGGADSSRRSLFGADEGCNGIVLESMILDATIHILDKDKHFAARVRERLA